MTTAERKEPHWIITMAEAGQIKNAVQGEFLNGYGEARIAMVGRSNVGKSSLLNMILNRKLARVSAEPGKTREIHAYFCPSLGGENSAGLGKSTAAILVDLPGYGFARAAQSDRNRWAQFIEAYLKEDRGIGAVLALLDSRHGPTDIDIEAIGFLRKFGFEVVPVMTKFDQVKTQKDRARRQKEVDQALIEIGFRPKSAVWVSIEDKRSIEILKRRIRELGSQVQAGAFEG